MTITHRATYAALVDAVFGTGTATFDVAVPETNAVIGALSNPTNFTLFKANFEQRLRRLNAAQQADGTLRREILAAVNKIVDRGWDGAYAELCALDYFLADTATGPGNLILDHTVPASQTLASEMGMQEANHDIRFPGLGVSMDTKLLSDKIGGILEGIFDDFRDAKGIRRLTILPTYQHDADYAIFESNRRKLLDEMLAGIDTAARPARLASTVVPGLSYEFAWDHGVFGSESVYSPHEHAKNHHRLLFGHAKKFSKVEPTVIVFVLFPWTGERVFLFDWGKQEFFKQLGREFFMSYLASPDSAKSYNRQIRTSMSAGDLTRYLSGVIYLDDDTIKSTTPNNLNVKACFLWNPNAVHSLLGSDLDAYMQRRGALDLCTTA